VKGLATDLQGIVPTATPTLLREGLSTLVGAGGQKPRFQIQLGDSSEGCRDNPAQRQIAEGSTGVPPQAELSGATLEEGRFNDLRQREVRGDYNLRARCQFEG